MAINVLQAKATNVQSGLNESGFS